MAADRERVFGHFPILAERRRQPAGTLSGGEQQMLAIGRCLMARPRLILFDEPSLGLAPTVTETVFQIIAGIQREGTTVLMVEQNAYMALQLAGRAYVMETGRITLEGPRQRPDAERPRQASLSGRLAGTAQVADRVSREPESAGQLRKRRKRMSAAGGVRGPYRAPADEELEEVNGSPQRRSRLGETWAPSTSEPR